MEHQHQSSDDAKAPPISKRRGLRYGFIAFLAVAVFLIAVVIGFRDNIFRWIINPRTPFQTYVPPPEPDYSQASSWAIYPSEPPPGAWEKGWGVDVFFIHPTTYFASTQWNAPIDDAKATKRLERDILPNHARPFARAGAIYAPRYRQATLLTELNFGEDSRQSLSLAYSDILNAFDTYMNDRNRGRAIIIVGIQQGGLYAQRLLAERFNTPRMQERLVAAYLIDSAVPMDLFNTQLEGLAACEKADGFGCVVSWGVVLDGDDSEADRFRNRSKSWNEDGTLLSTTGRRLVCINPLLWSTNSDFAPKRLHRGGASASGLDSDSDPAILPGAVATQCVDGVLITDRPRESQLRRSIRLGARFKTPDFNLFYADIEDNAELRAKAAISWLLEHGARPAPPMGDSISIQDAPINEVQDALVNPSSALRGRDEDAGNNED